MMDDKDTKDVVICSMPAIGGALLAIVLMMAALASHAVAQTTLASQTTQEKKIQFGAGDVSDSSFKFGEYNGLQNQGPFGVGGFDLRGGSSYDSSNTWRWRFTGADLGLETRDLTADFGKQGKFRVFLRYDELLANRSDTYLTPYLGAGTSTLSLQANWIKPVVPQLSAGNFNFRGLDPIAGAGNYYNNAGVLTAPTAAQLATLAKIIAADVPDFHLQQFSTKRSRFDTGLTLNPNDHWDIPLGFSYEHKFGLQELGAVSSQVREFAAILPAPVDWETEEANAAVNYKLKKGFVSVAYYGSFFHNNAKSLTWQDVNDLTKSATMAAAPSNQFNQFSGTFGYKFSDTIKLVVTGSYGRITQDDAFLTPDTAANGQLAFGLPIPSLNGLVVTSTVDAKLTAKPTKKWNLTAAYKFDNHDNQTPVNIYLFQDANEPKTGVSPFAGIEGLPANLGNNTNIYENRAYSREINQVDLTAEYAIAKRQYLVGAYQWQKIDRSCNGDWINCADAPTTNEHTIRGEWHKNIGTVTGRLEYAYSRRRGFYDENAFLSLVPMAGFVPNVPGATISLLGYLQQTGLTAFGPFAGFPTVPLTGNQAVFSPNNNIVPVNPSLYGSRNNINEIPGFRRFFVADRNRHKVRSQAEWQATEKLSLQGTGEFNFDDYLNTIYGLRKSTFWAATADLGYAATPNLALDLYYTFDHQLFDAAGDAYGANSNGTFVGQAADTLVSGGCFTTVLNRNLNQKIDPCLNWSKNQRNNIDTLGFAIRQKNLVSGKVELGTQVMYTRARTDSNVFGGSYLTNPLALAAPAPPLPAGTAAVFFIPASPYPTQRDDEIMVRPSATIALRKDTSFQAFYLFQRLMGADWAYAGLQFGTGTNYLPTAEVVPTYVIHAGGFSLTYTF